MSAEGKEDEKEPSHFSTQGGNKKQQSNDKVHASEVVIGGKTPKKQDHVRSRQQLQ